MIDFGTAAESICTTVSMVGVETNFKGTLQSGESFDIENDVIIIIGIIGKQKYNLAFAMSSQTAQVIAGRMMGGETYEMDEIGRSAIGELINMVSGNILSSLAEEGFDITPPTVIAGNHISCVMQSFESNKLTFETESGLLEVYFALEG